MYDVPIGGSEEANRAVSPVIGVILMVAITVILAAVIGAFVLEIGDQQETAPSTSFDSEQQMEYLQTWNSGNLTTVSLSHAGGDVVETSSMTINAEGNESTYDIYERPGSLNKAVPLPDYSVRGESVRQCPPGETCQFQSGQSMRVVTYGISREVWEANPDIQYWDNQVAGFNRPNGYPAGTDLAWFGDGAGPPNEFKPAQVLVNGDEVKIVWEASSGGKTQTLFKYTVQ